MARLARLVILGIPHHITHRGNRRADIFLTDEDRRVYLGFLAAYADTAQLRIWAYCLMRNRVHLIAVPETAEALARGVGLAHRRYAAWINRRERWAGHLWANRYFSTPLDDAHHYEAVRYVERNPVRAGLVARAEAYAWSSARANGRWMPGDGLLDEQRPYRHWEIADWSAWLAEPEDTEKLLALRRCTASGRPCGNETFLDRLESQLGQPLRPRKRGRKPAVSVNGGDETGEMFK